MDRWCIHKHLTVTSIQPEEASCTDGANARTGGTVDKRYVRVVDDVGSATGEKSNLDVEAARRGDIKVRVGWVSVNRQVRVQGSMKNRGKQRWWGWPDTLTDMIGQMLVTGGKGSRRDGRGGMGQCRGRGTAKREVKSACRRIGQVKYTAAFWRDMQVRAPAVW